MALIFEGRGVLRDCEHDGRAELAWNIAALVRNPNPPAFETLLSKKPAAREQSWQEQKSHMRRLGALPANAIKEV